MKVSNVSFGNVFLARSGREAAEHLAEEAKKRGITKPLSIQTYGATVNVGNLGNLPKGYNNYSAVLCGTEEDENLIRRAVASINKRKGAEEGFETLRGLVDRAVNALKRN